MAKKYGVVDMYYSILTKGPVSGVPTYFIELDEESSTKMSGKKIAKKVDKECAGYNIHLSGKDVYNSELIAWCIASYARLVVEVNTSNTAPDDFHWDLLQHPHVFVYANVDSEEIEKGLMESVTAYIYTISNKQVLDPTGLPKGLFMPQKGGGIIVAPANTKATERVVQICKHYGYYLSIEYKNFIGIR